MINLTISREFMREICSSLLEIMAPFSFSLPFSFLCSFFRKYAIVLVSKILEIHLVTGLLGKHMKQCDIKKDRTTLRKRKREGEQEQEQKEERRRMGKCLMQNDCNLRDVHTRNVARSMVARMHQTYCIEKSEIFTIA